MEENWINIKNFEDSYQVSDLIRIKSLPRIVNGNGRSNSTRLLKEKIRKQHINKKGYWGVILCKDGKSYYKETHRIIAETFIPNPNNLPEVNHKNGIKTDNRIENLEWCTKSENIQHAVTTGLKVGLSCSENPMSKLTEKQVGEIRQLKGKLMHKEIAKLYNVTRETITYILNNKTWKHVNKRRNNCNNE